MENKSDISKKEHSHATSLPTNDNSKKPYWFNPKYPKLSEDDDIGKAALEGQVITYPQVVRQAEDPIISGQEYTSLSFNLLETPVTFRDKKIHGFVKLRGNSSNEETAVKNANKLVLETDSKFQIRICRTGTWVPITESDSVVKELYDVRENEKETHLRDQAVKEKEAEARRLARQIREAETKLKEGGDIYDDPEAIDFYVMKRVTEMKLYDTLDSHMLKIDELRKKLGEQRIILKRLEINHPDYKEKWLDVYNKERLKISLPKMIPGESQFADYESETLESLLSKYPEPPPEATGGSSGRKTHPVHPENDGDKDIVRGTGAVVSAKSYSYNAPDNKKDDDTDSTREGPTKSTNQSTSTKQNVYTF